MKNDDIVQYLVQVIDDFVQHSDREDLLHNIQTLSEYLNKQNTL